MITLENVCCGYGKKEVLLDVSLSLRKSELTCLLGKNGVGKTTLFKTILGLIPAISGKIYYDGKEHRRFSARDFAKYISYVPQAHGTPFPFTVLNVVLMGQYAHAEGMFGKPIKKNMDIAIQSLHTLGIEHLTDKNFSKISGGEKQLVLIARAVAQQPHFIAMDEPTANLDMGNQYTVLRLSQLLKQQGFGIIMNTHTPEHALNYADEVALLQDGRILTHGNPKTVIHSEILSKLYGADIEMITTKMSNGKYKYVCVHNTAQEECCAFNY
jgi:iron complex transport system ATP-binding protein